MPHRLTILVIDDSETDLLLAEEAFSDHAEWVKTLLIRSGAEAIGYMQDQKHPIPDVVVTDLNMPGMTGLDVIRVMKSDPRLKLIPVVVLSTSSHPRDIAEAYSLHASSYLVKAADFQSFIEQIEAFVGFWRNAKVVAAPS